MLSTLQPKCGQTGWSKNFLLVFIAVEKETKIGLESVDAVSK